MIRNQIFAIYRIRDPFYKNVSSLGNWWYWNSTYFFFSFLFALQCVAKEAFYFHRKTFDISKMILIATRHLID